jgi:cell division protein FtsB
VVKATESTLRTSLDGPAAQQQRRFRLIAALLILGFGVAGYVLGRVSGHFDITAARQLNQQLQTENQNFKTQISGLNARIAVMQAALNTSQAALDAIMPRENTYNVVPNQSLIVGDGHLTLGLVGSPANEGITINVNGMQHSAVAGDVIRIDVDPSTKCQVAVQSFDMFKAVVTASCAAVTPQ